MKSIKILSALIMLSATALGQTIKYPQVNSSEDAKTVITQIETNSKNTIVSFRYTGYGNGDWVQLNKSMYLQDANGEDRYNYVRSEGIPLRPEKLVITTPKQEVNFKVYFEKLKPGTKNINVIERARSLAELNNGVSFLNYFNVNLTKSQPNQDGAISAVQVILAPPPPVDQAIEIAPTIPDMNNIGSMVNNMYSGMLTAQLNTYSKPEVLSQIAKITRDFYEALIKAGFAPDSALRIVISKPLIAMDGENR
jgi:hypothetical protein